MKPVDGGTQERDLRPDGAKSHGITPTRSSESKLATEDTIVAADDGSAPPLPGPQSALSRGTTVGRLLILRVLGAGGMGVVYAAHDPELDRKVALKIIRGSQARWLEARTRLLREAQALAKLTHPNVVTVHDVGTHGQQVWLSMEFVVGRTLGDWIEREKPSWRDVVEVIKQAARGVAAAHAAGLLHRDLKPENIMLGDDGRVRVMDFGLARVGGERRDAPNPIPGTAHAPLSIALTAAGAVMGTPAYMAPEQFLGQVADERTDVFALCATLWEALYGQRAFVGRTFHELAAAVVSGETRSPPTGARVPRWLRRTVALGLSVDPATRYASVDELIAALDADPTHRRRRLLVTGLTLATLGGAASWVAMALRANARYCKHAADALAGVWDDERQAVVKRGILDTGLSYAPGMWAQVESRLDAYADEWVAARTSACEATHHGEQSGELLDLRMHCLDERRQHLQAAVDELARADGKVVQRAVDIVLSVPRLERCADVNALTADVPSPEDPEVAAQVAVLSERLVKTRVKMSAGKFDEGMALIDDVVAGGEPLGYEPLMTRVWLLQGRLQHGAARYPEAEATLRRAVDSAIVQGMKDEAAIAATQLVWVIGDRQARYAEVRPWAQLTDSLVRATSTAAIQAEWHNCLGAVKEGEGEYEESREYFERALDLREQTFGPSHPYVAQSLGNLGMVLTSLGRYEDARVHLERALAIEEHVLDPGHPSVAATLHDLGRLANNTGDPVGARAHHERALAIRERALGPDHPYVANSLEGLSASAAAEGDLERARSYLERVLAIREKALGPDHPRLALALSNLGAVAENLGRIPDARAYHERALEIRERALGPDHPKVASSIFNLGLVALLEGDNEPASAYFERALAIRESALGRNHPAVGETLELLATVAFREGELERASAHHRRALAILEQARGANHPSVAEPLRGLGEVLLARADARAALPPLERALSIQNAAGVDPVALAETRFTLARALWAASSPGDPERPRARELATLARATYAESGARSVEYEEVTAWLNEHPS